MKDNFERVIGEAMRQASLPGSPTTMNAGGQSAASSVAIQDARPSTMLTDDGDGVELLILDSDPLNDPGFYLGDDDIDPLGT